MKWILLHPNITMEHLGFIPAWLHPQNPAPAREQLDAGYAFGGFQPFEGFKLGSMNQLIYPGDPPQYPIAQCEFRDELVTMYQGSWVAVIQKDRSFVVARMD